MIKSEEHERRPMHAGRRINVSILAANVVFHCDAEQIPSNTLPVPAEFATDLVVLAIAF